MFFRLCFVLSAALLSFAQEAALTPAEAAFAESLHDVTLTGFYTRGNGGELKQDRYVIQKVSKSTATHWKFDVRIQYNGKDLAVSLPIPIQWAGDTPVIVLNNFPVPGSGVFTARVLFHNGAYVGTWAAAGEQGGKMFGSIQKNLPPKP